MNTKQFIAVLRKVVREEVKQALREQLKDAYKQRIVKPAPKSATSIVEVSEKAVKRLPRFGGPVADILNETLAAMLHNPDINAHEDLQGHQHNTQGEWPSLGTSPMTSQVFAHSEQDGFAHTDLPTTTGDDPTLAFVKDYRAVTARAKQISDSKG